jgi:hypothetical protein
MLTVFWNVAPCSLALMMEAVNTSETSANFYESTRHKIPEDIFILAAVRT